jgi:hypothetical protein
MVWRQHTPGSCPLMTTGKSPEKQGKKARFLRVHASLYAVAHAGAILDPSRRPKRPTALWRISWYSRRAKVRVGTDLRKEDV